MRYERRAIGGRTMDTSTGWGSGGARADAYGVDVDPPAHALSSSVSRASSHAVSEDGPYHYRTEREVGLRELARTIPALRPHAAKLPDVMVCFARATARSGMPVRVVPRAVPEVLFLDHTDLATLRAGLEVPELDAAIATLRALEALG